MEHVEQDLQEIECRRMHKMLYLAIKLLQQSEHSLVTRLARLLTTYLRKLITFFRSLVFLFFFL